MTSFPSGSLAAGIVLCGFMAAQTGGAAAPAPSSHSKHRIAHHEAASLPPLQDSFLPTQVSTLNDLVREVKSDKAVRERYGRFYHLPAGAVPMYFRTHLVAKKLSQAGDFTISRIHSNGVIYPVRLPLAKGTSVFTNKNGKPAILCDSGNPMTEYEMAVEIRKVYKTIEIPGKNTDTVMETEQQGVPAPVTINTPVYRSATPAPGGPNGSVANK